MSRQIENISSETIELTLDALMENAVRAIDGCSDLYVTTVADAMAAKAFDVRHKPSRSETFLEDAARFVITRDINLGVRLKLNHDRNIAMCDKFLLYTAGVADATKQAVQLDSSALSSMGGNVLATSPGRLFLARQEVDLALADVTRFRSIIAAKYERLAVQQASLHAKGRRGVNAKVAENQAKVGVYTAIDRYSSERGALANYVNLWIRQALIDKTNLQEGAAVEYTAGGDNQMSTVAVSIDNELLSETLEHVTEGYADRNAVHTRALSTIAPLRPVLRAMGESLRYPLNNRERAKLIKLS